MQFDKNLYHQINSTIQQSYQLQQQILTQLGRVTSSQQTTSTNIFASLKTTLNSIRQEIVQEWQPFCQQLISIVGRVSLLYSDKISYLEECLSQSRRQNKQQSEQIRKLQDLLSKQTRKNTVSSSRVGKTTSQAGISQRQLSESAEKINMSEYITVLNQSLLKECVGPSNRTLQLEPYQDFSQIKKKTSLQLQNVNFSLQLKKDAVPNYRCQPLKEQSNNSMIKKKSEGRGSSQGQQNWKRMPSPLSKGDNDSFFRALKINDNEWDGCKLQAFRKNLMNRRRVNR